ncbi:MAG TPA: hypothetical protein VGR79_04365 [Stellaceae bacterium]|nr:hypothetical protein [Stellaceae bacterium]
MLSGLSATRTGARLRAEAASTPLKSWPPECSHFVLDGSGLICYEIAILRIAPGGRQDRPGFLLSAFIGGAAFPSKKLQSAPNTHSNLRLH